MRMLQRDVDPNCDGELSDSSKEGSAVDRTGVDEKDSEDNSDVDDKPRRRGISRKCKKSGVSESVVESEGQEPGKNVVENVQVDRVGVKTGNHMIDQYTDSYWGVAYAFIFSYSCGFPDMPAFTKTGRGRRDDDAPRIDTWEWVSAMSRRVETSVAGDQSFGFLSWNYLFRANLNLTQSLCAYDP